MTSTSAARTGGLGANLLLLGLLVLAGIGQYRTWSTAANPPYGGGELGAGLDYYQFRFVPQAVQRRKMENFYSRPNRRIIGKLSLINARRPGVSKIEQRAAWRNASFYEGSIGTSGTPFFYTVFGVLQTDDYAHDLRVYRLVSLAASELGIVALCVALGFSLTRTVAMLALFSAWFGPFRGILEVSNVNHVQVGLVALLAFCARLPGRYLAPAAGGALMGLIMMFKPNPLFAAALWYLVLLARRNFVGFAVASVTGGLAALAAFAASSAYFGGPDCWVSWMTRTGRAVQSYAVWNLSFTSHLFEWTGLQVQVWVLGGLALAAAALILHPDRTIRSGAPGPAHDFRRALLVLSIGVMIPLIGLRVVWQHHLTLAIPLILFLLRPDGGERGYRTRVALTALALVLYLDVPFLLGMPYNGMLQSALTFPGSVILISLGFVELARRSVVPAAAPSR